LVGTGFAQEPVGSRKVMLGSSKTVSLEVPVAPRSVCSFIFPRGVDAVLLGDTKKFEAQVVEERTVSLKPISVEVGDTTTLQVMMDRDRIVTANIQVVSPERAVQEVRFEDEAGSRKPTPDMLGAIDQERAKAQEEAKHAFEAKRFRSLVEGLKVVPVEGQKVSDNIRLRVLDVGSLRTGEDFVRFELKNDSGRPFRILLAEVLRRKVGGFLWLRNMQEQHLQSELLCNQLQSQAGPGETLLCAVRYARPVKDTSWHIGLRVREGGPEPRTLDISRILEVYEY
jgi:hypothetical protein